MDLENVPPHFTGRLFDDCVPSLTCEPMDTPSASQSSRQQGILKYFGAGHNTKIVSVPSLVCGSCHCDGVELVMLCGGCGRSVCGVDGCLRKCVECVRQLCQCCSLLE